MGQTGAVIINLSVSLSLDSSPIEGSPWQRGPAPASLPEKAKRLQRRAKSTASKAVFSQNRGSTPVCRSKPITAAIRTAILSFPQRAAPVSYTHLGWPPIQTSNFPHQRGKILASIAVAPQGLLDYTVDLYPVLYFSVQPSQRLSLIHI